MQLQERPNVNVRIFVVLGTISLLLFIALAAAAPAKEKEPAGQKVDNGSFGVFVNGRRVATETFSIVQSNNGSVANSQFKTEPGADPAAQSSQLELTGNGELRRYERSCCQPRQASWMTISSSTGRFWRGSIWPPVAGGTRVSFRVRYASARSSAL